MVATFDVIASNSEANVGGGVSSAVTRDRVDALLRDDAAALGRTTTATGKRYGRTS
jgi:hypothetical protein